MYLDKNTVKKLEQSKSEAEAKILVQRGELLKYVGIDNKFNICVESQYRDVVKPIAQCISALNTELAKA